MTEQPYHIRYTDVRRRNTLKKALRLQHIFRELFMHKTEKEIVYMLSQCAHYHYGQKHQPLNADAQVMYEYLLTYNYNPYTVYKWFLVFVTNELVREEAESNRLSQKQVRKAAVTRKKQEEVSRCWHFMEAARKVAWELLAYD